MAKSKQRKLPNGIIKATRDVNAIARPLSALRLPFSTSQVEDRRRFHPLGSHATPRKFNTLSTNVVDKVGLTFQNPRMVITCARRKMRTQVLHAMNKTGRSGQRKPRRTPWSNVRCK